MSRARFVLKCVVCGHLCSGDGEYEPDTNCTPIEEIYKPCEHIQNGDDFEIVDEIDEDYYP